MLVKRRPPQLYVFVENNYRHEHAMITKLYIVVHILYDRHLYKCILWAFCACLKEALGCTHPTNCGRHCILYNKCSNSGNVATGKEYDHVPTSPDYPRGGRSETGWNLEGWASGMTWPACKHVSCHIAGMLALSCWKRKLFQTVW